MKTHCIPPRQNCSACQAEVRAAQMTEREWRRILWKHEVGSKIANALVLAVAGAMGHRIFRLVQSVAEPLTFKGLLPVLHEWRWVLWAELVLLALLGWLAWWCYPKVFQWDWDKAGIEDWDEKPEYRAAKICREQHEKTVWEAGVEIFKAQEAVRSELDQVQDRIEARMRKLEGQ